MQKIMRSIKKILKQNPIIIGCFFILVLMGLLCLNRFWSSITNEESTVITKDLERENTIEAFEKPDELLVYELAALVHKDLDLCIRGCSVDEDWLGQDFAGIIDEAEEFSYTTTIPPANQYFEYQPISFSEIIEQHTMSYEYFQNILGHKKSVNVKAIGIVLPEEQNTAEYQLYSRKLCKTWGSNAVCEMVALVEADGTAYQVSFTVMQYGNGYWKVFRFGSSLLDTKGDDFITESTQEKFDEITGAAKVDTFITALEKKQDSDKEEAKSDKKKVKSYKHPEKQILSPNYSITASLYGESAVDTIGKFILALQRKDSQKAMCYGMTDSRTADMDSVTTELIEKQGTFSREMQLFYYELVTNNKFSETSESLLSLNKTGAGIASELSPENIPYLNVAGVVSADEEEDDNQYIAVYTFDGNIYMSGYTMCESENGWQIESLSAEAAGLSSGEVRKITDKKYHELLD
ncbi:MAG: hypothetical protein PHN80_12560 [Hespellia sp.]|nr:hypothetical protein [Hespellia sp.]